MTSDLPPSLADALRPVLPELAGAIIEAIGREVPAYARPLEGPFGEALRRGVRTALARFVDGIEHPGDEDPEARALYVQLGRGEFRGGRSLDALLSAYRIGARLGGQAIATAAADGTALAWVPDPEAPGRRAQLEAAVEDAPAALGPAVSLARAPQSLSRARAAYALLLEGRLPAGRPLAARRHPAPPP